MRTSKLENSWAFVYTYQCEEKPVASCYCLEFLEIGRCFFVILMLKMQILSVCVFLCARERVLGGLVAAASTKSKCVEAAVYMYDASAIGRCFFCGEWCQRVKRRKITGSACSGHPLANEAEADKECIARLEGEVKDLRVQLEALQQALTAAQSQSLKNNCGKFETERMPWPPWNSWRKNIIAICRSL